MRKLVLLLVAAVVLAGCVGQAPSSLPAADSDSLTPGGGAAPDAGTAAPPGQGSSQEPASGSEPGQESPSNATPPREERPRSERPPPSEDEPTFCESEDGCKFWDDLYHEYVLYNVDTATVDVLIVPSASPGAAQDTQTIRQAIVAWGAGIETLAEPWFAGGFELNVYVLGEDSPPQEAIDDPEIIVLAAEYNPALLFGIGYQLPSLPCRGAALERYAPHEHHGLTVKAANCESGGYTCVAANTNFLLGGPHRLYDLVAHEVGHCLGIGHVGDALDFSAKRVPVRDIMSYQHDPEQVHCVSNLNVRTLERVYAPLFPASGLEPLRPGSFLAMDRAGYAQVTCDNPGAAG